MTPTHDLEGRANVFNCRKIKRERASEFWSALTRQRFGPRRLVILIISIIDLVPRLFAPEERDFYSPDSQKTTGAPLGAKC